LPFVIMLQAACSGAGPMTGGVAVAVAVNVVPSVAVVAPTTQLSFTANVTGTINTSVQWMVAEGANGGAVSDSGVYTAPSSTGVFHVIATSKADTSTSGSAVVTVASSAINVTISPRFISMAPGAAQKFTCTVTNSTDTACIFSVVGGTGSGQIDATGLYTAGAQGNYNVVATSRADSSKKDTAYISVAAPASPGVWSNVTPPGLDLIQAHFNNDNFGAQDIIVDPVRPSDLYAFVCHQGVYKSVDFGLTFTGPINTGTGGSMVTAGKPWTAAIDSNPARDPATNPTLYTAAGNAAVGVLKSTDGGVSWTAYATNNSTAGAQNAYFAQDVYALDVDPYDNQHIIAGFHAAGMSESTDGGQHWTTLQVPTDQGGSVYPFFVKTGNAATTRKTWLTIAQANNGVNGTWRTTDGGATWQKVSQVEHVHGTAQIFDAGGGVIYIGGTFAQGGIYRSTDYGATWTQVENAARGGTSTIIGTPTMLYSGYGYAGEVGFANLMTSTNGASWVNTTSFSSQPSGMTWGPKRFAITYDGLHRIVIGGFWDSGIWRYVEP
jgi:hypothetical protein